MSPAQELITDILKDSEITVNGSASWDIQVNDDRFFSRVLHQKSVGLGDSYVENWWDCENLSGFIERLLRHRADRSVKGGVRELVTLLPSLLFNLQTRYRSNTVARRHYDLGNDLFQTFLDDYLQYSCAFFNGTDDLNQAQRYKMRLICNKLELTPEHSVLDVGCGWGGLARFMAEEYGCRVTGINISEQQIAFAQDFCVGLPVEILSCDYRDLEGQYDRIVSVGMFEHVGPRNYRTFMRSVQRCLKPDGLFLLHTIGSNTSVHTCDPWIERNIFPNGCLPSIAQVGRSAEDVFVLEDLHNIGPHYSRTLEHWLRNFRQGWEGLRDRYGEQFRRMWEYYLQASAGCFRARDIQLWQFLFTRPGARQPRCRCPRPDATALGA